MKYKLSYLGREAKEHQFIVDRRRYIFKRGSSLVVDDNVASILKDKKDSIGNPLFVVIKAEDEVIDIPSSTSEKPVAVPKAAPVTTITPPDLPKPPLSSKKTIPPARKILDKRKQGKLM